jgi:pSer/pThr/pTyr-binding forkhead associated (FHA) protein
MVQLHISTGTMAGVTHHVRHFPFSVGRTAGSGLRLEEPGVWDHHLTLDFDSAQGFVLTAYPQAIAHVNGWPIESVLLRNGDTIELGAVRLRFWIGEVKQSRLRVHENLVWAALALVTAAEIALLLGLLK